MSSHPFTKPVVLALATLAAMLGTNAMAQAEVRIAVVGPLSGPAANYGKDNERGAQMAIADLNASHAQIGGKPVKFAPVSEDDRADSKQGTAETADKRRKPHVDRRRYHLLNIIYIV